MNALRLHVHLDSSIIYEFEAVLSIKKYRYMFVRMYTYPHTGNFKAK